MKTAVMITPDGIQTDLKFDESSALEVLQKAVGGYVQSVDLLGITMWVNEEGKLNGLEHNPYGQVLWEAAFINDDYIVGNIVLTGQTDENGFTTGLPQSFIDTVLTPSNHHPEDCEDN